MADSPKPEPLTGQAIRRGLTAAGLAWLVPGLGHLYLGCRRRAAVFFVLVATAFTLGVACSGNLAIVDSLRAPVLTRLQVLANLAIGPAEPILRRAIYGELVYKNPRPGVTSLTPPLERRRKRSLHPWGLYGSSYLLAAGLMNMLLIFDAWDVGIGRKS